MPPRRAAAASDRIALAAIAAAVPRVLSSYRQASGRTPDAGCVSESIDVLETFLRKFVDGGTASLVDIATELLLPSSVGGPLLQLVAHGKGIICDGDQRQHAEQGVGKEDQDEGEGEGEEGSGAELRRRLWESAARLFTVSLSVIADNAESVRPSVLEAAERVLSALLQMGTLRCYSGVLAAAAAPLEGTAQPAAAIGAAAAAAAVRRSSSGGGGSTSSGAAAAAPWRGWSSQEEVAAARSKYTPLLDAAYLVMIFVLYIQQAHAKAEDLADGGGAAATDSSRAAAAAASAAVAAQRHRDGGRQLYRRLVAELHDSQVMEHGARLLLLLLLRHSPTGSDPAWTGRRPAAAAGGRGRPVAIDREALCNLSVALNHMLHMLDSAFIRSAGTSLGVPGTPDSRPDVPPPPWGPCVQYLAVANAVTTLAAAGFGGGADGKGTFGMPTELAAAATLRRPQGRDSGGPSHYGGRDPEVVFIDTLLTMLEAQLDGGGAQQPPSGQGAGADSGDGRGVGGRGAGDGGGGGWSFILGPRAAHRLCMRIADLAIASGQQAGAGADAAGAGRRQSRAQQRRPALLRSAVAWHVAVRALGVARGLLLGPLSQSQQRRRRLAAAAGTADLDSYPEPEGEPQPVLPAEYWEAVARVLRVDAAPVAVNTDLLGTRGTLCRRAAHMLVVPDMEATASLASAAPSASVAAAFSAGLVAAVERCSRFLGRSDDPDDIKMAAGMLLPALAHQPSFLQHMMAFGPPDQVASWIATLAKLLSRCVEEAEVEVGKAERTAAQVAAAAQVAGRRGGVQPLAWQRLGGDAQGALYDHALRMEVEDADACRCMQALAVNMGWVLEALLADPRVTEPPASEGPATATATAPPATRPQLRQLLSIMLQRWLPPLARAALLAPRLPGYDVSLYSLAQNILTVLGAMAFLNAADPEQVRPPLWASTASIASIGASASSSGTAAAAAAPAARAAVEAATASAGTEAAAAAPTAAESWRRWLRSSGGGGSGMIKVLGMMLRNARTMAWSLSGVAMFVNCLLAAVLAEPELLRAELRALAAPDGGGGGVRGGGGAAGGSGGLSVSGRRTGEGRAGGGGRPAAGAADASAFAADAAALERQARSVVDDAGCFFYGILHGNPGLVQHTAHVISVLRCLCIEDGEVPITPWIVGPALAHNSVASLTLAAAALLSPGEAAAGLPPACSNPRCTNLTLDSDADLAAAAAASGGAAAAGWLGTVPPSASGRTGARGTAPSVEAARARALAEAGALEGLWLLGRMGRATQSPPLIRWRAAGLR
ncbi:hypothetical protein GPECTOR_16g630 [Gonium pectorale]|uniref:Uncharacterized protein n=1 Tax=Gonium pectorale TaxID=33097 RepID=A0A150GKS6_GONPE|nr:hypothetical protein GPECTOR_16g630 [Gonium pectorale]|eukprot:KXZ50456.1 hypothetical protein GPECTOR_16g630 [Gonium pectorale]